MFKNNDRTQRPMLESTDDLVLSVEPTLTWGSDRDSFDEAAEADQNPGKKKKKEKKKKKKKKGFEDTQNYFPEIEESRQKRSEL